eukprot:m.271219 g.271219  ORF g.271219 m.271219 type:complete len:73 (-) comp19746_c0_seq3:355-573(-)
MPSTGRDVQCTPAFRVPGVNVESILLQMTAELFVSLSPDTQRARTNHHDALPRLPSTTLYGLSGSGNFGNIL